MADAGKGKSPVMLAAVGAVLFAGLVYVFWISSGAPAEEEKTASSKTHDRAGWKKLHDKLNASTKEAVERPTTTLGANDPDPADEPSGRDEVGDEPGFDTEDELTDEELAERAEDIRRPLGGLGLELIPPPDRPIAERAQATQELYNSGQDIAAREVALALLEEDGGNEALLRIVVSTACMDGIADLARKHLSRLPAQEHRAMRMHCLRHGTVLDELSEAEDEAALDEFLATRGEDWDPARTDPPPGAAQDEE